jgi:hypothetical protein
MIKLILTLCLIVFALIPEGIAQTNIQDSSYYSYVLREFYNQYDTVIVYRKTCPLTVNGESIILAKKNTKWKAYLGTEYYKHDMQLGYSKFNKVRIKRYNNKSILISKTVNNLLNLGLQSLNADSLNLCEGKPNLQKNGTTSRSTIMTLDGCGYRFEFMTKDEIQLYRVNISLKACYKLTHNKDQETFLKCEKLIYEELDFMFKK